MNQSEEDGAPLLGTPQLNRAESYERPPEFLEAKNDEVKKPTGCKGVISRFLLSDDNPDFALNMQVALRGAIFVVICGLPFILPDGLCGPLDFIMKKGMYTNSVIVFFVYNYSAYLGDVISAVTYGLRGTALAVLDTWLLYTIFPEGVQDDSPAYVYWIGLANGFIVIFSMFYFNFSISTTIFTVSNFVFFWMSFMDQSKEVWAAPFSPEFRFWDDVGVHSLFSLTVGGILAISATLFPYPILAQDSAKDIAEELTTQMPKLWRLMLEYFSSDAPNVYVKDEVHRKLTRLEKIQGNLSTRVASSWWECMGLGKRNVSRRMLTALDAAIGRSYDRIKGAWVLARAENWTEHHLQLMSAIKSDVNQCIDKSEELIRACIKATEAGSLDDAGQENIELLRRELGTRKENLTKNIRDQREKMRGDKKLGQYCLQEHMVSHMICVNICAYIRITDEFALKLIEQRTKPATLPMAHTTGSIAALCDGVNGHNNIMFMLRGCCSIFTGLAIGYFGYGELLSDHTATVACTASVLQSRFLGSALVKNLGRIQGVVIGSIFGEIVRSFFPTCIWWNVALLVLSIFCYAVVTLFVYHNSKQYSYIGCLLAAFGIQKMLKSHCVAVSTEHVVDKEADYNMLISTVFAVSLIIVFDMMLSSSRASDKAYHALMDTYKGFKDTVAKVFDKQQTKLDFHKASLLASIALAEDMGAEAFQEPRYWRTEWRDDTYQKTMKFFRQIRYGLAALEYSSVVMGQDGADKNEVAKKLQDMVAWNKLGSIISAKLDAVKTLLPIFVHENVNRFPGFMDENATKQFAQQANEAIDTVVNEVSGISDLVKQGTGLEEDPVCQLCMLIGASQALLHGLRDVQHIILRA